MDRTPSSPSDTRSKRILLTECLVFAILARSVHEPRPEVRAAALGCPARRASKGARRGAKAGTGAPGAGVRRRFPGGWPRAPCGSGRRFSPTRASRARFRCSSSSPLRVRGQPSPCSAAAWHAEAGFGVRAETPGWWRLACRDLRNNLFSTRCPFRYRDPFVRPAAPRPAPPLDPAPFWSQNSL